MQKKELHGRDVDKRLCFHVTGMTHIPFYTYAITSYVRTIQIRFVLCIAIAINTGLCINQARPSSSGALGCEAIAFADGPVSRSRKLNGKPIPRKGASYHDRSSCGCTNELRRCKGKTGIPTVLCHTMTYGAKALALHERLEHRSQKMRLSGPYVRQQSVGDDPDRYPGGDV